MSGPHLLAVTRAEIRKLFRRTSARLGLVLALVVGVGVPGLRLAARLVEASVAEQVGASQGAGAAALAPIAPEQIVYSTLWVRNLFFLRLLIIMLAALVFAGEYQNRTLREDLVRPVSRAGVLLAKWAALSVWIVASVAAVVVPATLISMVSWGFSGDWGAVFAAAALTVVADAAFAVLALAVAVVTRSVVGTIVGMVLFYVTDLAVWVGLALLGAIPISGIPDWGRDAATAARPWLPSAAFGVWTQVGPDGAWVWQSFASLAVVTVVAAVVAERLFARTDVP